MIIFTALTKGCDEMFNNHFIPSLAIGQGFVLVVERIDGDDGDFMSSRFNEITSSKMSAIARQADSGDGDVIFYCDADIRFYKPLLGLPELLDSANVDMLMSNDGNGARCAGCILFRASEKNAEFFSYVSGITKDYRDDQDAILSELADESSWISRNYKIGLLPDTFYTVGPHWGKWPENKPKSVPADIVLHHANFTVGVKNKIDLLNYVWKLHQEQTAI